MKSAIYIEEGVVQLVLTPIDKFEKNALASFQEKKMSVQIYDGTFYDCQGGWTRQGSNDHSLILRIEKETPT